MAAVVNGVIGTGTCDDGRSGGTGALRVRVVRVIWEARVKLILVLQAAQVVVLQMVSVWYTIRQLKSVIGCASSRCVSSGSAVGCPKECQVVPLMCNWCTTFRFCSQD